MSKNDVRWRWYKSPFSTAKAEMACRKNGWPYKWVGTVLHVHKPGKGWFKFTMMRGSETVYRYVRPPARVTDVSTQGAVVPTFYCERCKTVQDLDEMVVVYIDCIDYTVCKACKVVAIKSARTEGAKVEIL